MINNSKNTWFSFFSSVNDHELLELQNSLYNIFKILTKELKFKDFMYRIINVAMYMKVRKDKLYMNIPDMKNRMIYIDYFDKFVMNNACFEDIDTEACEKKVFY